MRKTYIIGRFIGGVARTLLLNWARRVVPVFVVASPLLEDVG